MTGYPPQASPASRLGYLLHMSDEIHDWLADLCASDPAAAAVVGQALMALLSQGASLGPPAVISLAETAQPENLPDALDRVYQEKLERMQVVRHAVAEAATLARDIQSQLAGAQAQPAHDEVAELRRLLPGVLDAEQQLGEKGRLLQARVEAFRSRKEVLKAVYVAAQAERAVHEATADLARGTGDPGTPDNDRDLPVTQATVRLREITDEIDRELRLESSAEDLLELRPAAPHDNGTRILFAIEPPGTALLIAVLEGGEAVRDHYDEAVLLAAGVLRRARTGRAPEAATHAFRDAQSFLDEFFPDSASEVSASTVRVRTLAEQRAHLGLTQAQVAEQMHIPPENVSAIEQAEPGATGVRALAAYIEALGGQLEIVAAFDGERVLLR
jgi:hypothetical protein